MKIKTIEITNVGGISHLALKDVNPKINIICGENGVGKTNLLDSICACFSEFDKNVVSKKSGSEIGSVVLNAAQSIEPFDFNLNVEIRRFEPDENDSYLHASAYNDHRNNILYLKTNRHIDYKKVRAINSDPDATYRSRFNTSGLNNEDIKDWLLNRILHSKHENHLTETQLKNLNLSKKCFSVFDPNYSFSRLDTKNEVFVSSPSGEIYFEYLSSGFKSSIFILLGLIKEIDYRYEKKRIAAEDYEGLILIDEIEIHLHPEWQGRICNILKEIFPKAQFFITTHSPHVVQTAAYGEVIALERINDKVKKRPLPSSKYGYQGWTIEEILEDIMGMQDLRTKNFNRAKQLFDNALENEDKAKAEKAYQELDKMLHPQHPLRPVFEIQLNQIKEDRND